MPLQGITQGLPRAPRDIRQNLPSTSRLLQDRRLVRKSMSPVPSPSQSRLSDRTASPTPNRAAGPDSQVQVGGETVPETNPKENRQTHNSVTRQEGHL